MDGSEQIDRLDVADFNRRIEGLAERVGQLATAVAVQNEREAQKSVALEAAINQRYSKVDAMFAEMKNDIKDMKSVIYTGRGAIWVLSIIGTVSLFVATFWEKLWKIGH